MKPETSPAVGFLLGSAAWLLLEYLPLKSNTPPPHTGEGRFCLAKPTKNPTSPIPAGRAAPDLAPCRCGSLAFLQPLQLGFGTEGFKLRYGPAPAELSSPQRRCSLLEQRGFFFFCLFSNGMQKGLFHLVINEQPNHRLSKIRGAEKKQYPPACLALQ